MKVYLNPGEKIYFLNGRVWPDDFPLPLPSRREKLKVLLRRIDRFMSAPFPPIR